MNALRISNFPKICRFIPVNEHFEGDHVVQQLVKEAGNTIFARRFKKGIMAFGLDESIKNTFVSCIAGQLNYHPFQQISTPSSCESSEHRLVLDALAHSIVREGGLRLERRFGHPTLVVVEDEKPERFRALRKNLSEGSVDAQLSGVSNGYKWYEALDLLRGAIQYKFTKKTFYLGYATFNFNPYH